MPTAAKDISLLEESDLTTEKGLPAMEVDRRLFCLSRVHRRVESAVSFYLQEVDERGLYLEYGHSSTVSYAKERLGFEERKTLSLLKVARELKKLPKMKEAFQQGDIPWTKAREAVKAATPETDELWLEKALQLSNRQLEQEVKKTLPPVEKMKLVLTLEGEMIDVWEQTKEACQRIAGQTLSDIQVFDLICAEILCTYALTPPLSPDNDREGGYARSILERDRWQCSRPGCHSRTGLHGHHLEKRSQGGSDKDENKTLACAVCHNALEQGRLKVSGRAPDQLTWEGPFGVIEKPLPLPESDAQRSGVPRRPGVEPTWAREEAASYGDRGADAAGWPGLVTKDAPDDRSRDHYRSHGHYRSRDHYGTGELSDDVNGAADSFPRRTALLDSSSRFHQMRARRAKRAATRMPKGEHVARRENDHVINAGV